MSQAGVLRARGHARPCRQGDNDKKPRETAGGDGICVAVRGALGAGRAGSPLQGSRGSERHLGMPSPRFLPSSAFSPAWREAQAAARTDSQPGSGARRPCTGSARAALGSAQGGLGGCPRTSRLRQQQGQ